MTTNGTFTESGALTATQDFAAEARAVTPQSDSVPGSANAPSGGESKPEKRRTPHPSQRVKAEATRACASASDARPPFTRDLPALHRLQQKIRDNTCPESGLTTTDLDQHITGITNMVIRAKGWDRIRAEYGDELRQSYYAKPLRPCVVCEKPTRALSQICTDHPLDAA